MKNILIFIFLFTGFSTYSQNITVGAKHFNEGYILSEIISQLLEDNGFKVKRVYNLGGTLVCFEALKNGAIDVYPEYTGTIASEILSAGAKIPNEEISKQLHSTFKMEMSGSFGFSNSYGLVVLRTVALDRKLALISDLKDHPEITIGLSYEFLKRQDGWDNLAKVYQLPLRPTGLEHGLAYEALRNKKIDVTDAYTTDGEISRDNLVVLEDDLSFFPSYEAVALHSENIDRKAKTILSKLEGSLSEESIQQLNAAVLFEKKSFAEVAHSFLTSHKLVSAETETSNVSTWNEILSKTGTHLALTFLALLLAIIVAIPLGISIYWNPSISKPILYFVSLLQTIPSIALLAITIPLLGIGLLPALVALFLYALLPILRNTITGLQTVDPLLKKVSEGMGLTRRQQLLWIEFPLASPVILSGIRTASVINVGTATLAAFIGAGGLGEFIVTGLALNNTQLILQGAIPAAMLAIMMELLFELIGWWLIPKHLRSNAG
ncbi:MAG: ABC transporter permease subunit [Cyclobacteriaceae bacterium]|nr:ABC transporter permease subunit [Cyclobacteriaceae bacterium]